MTQAIVYAMSDIVLTILAVVTLGVPRAGRAAAGAGVGKHDGWRGRTFLSLHPLLATAPGVALIITGLALSLIGDGLALELSRG